MTPKSSSSGAKYVELSGIDSVFCVPSVGEGVSEALQCHPNSGYVRGRQLMMASISTIAVCISS